MSSTSTTGAWARRKPAPTEQVSGTSPSSITSDGTGRAEPGARDPASAPGGPGEPGARRGERQVARLTPSLTLRVVVLSRAPGDCPQSGA